MQHTTVLQKGSWLHWKPAQSWELSETGFLDRLSSAQGDIDTGLRLGKPVRTKLSSLFYRNQKLAIKPGKEEDGLNGQVHQFGEMSSN